MADLFSWYRDAVGAVLRRTGPIPRHVAFIMDGNRRYARQRGLAGGTDGNAEGGGGTAPTSPSPPAPAPSSSSSRVVEGHRAGYAAMVDAVGWCLTLGVTHVTLYAFSLDNYGRAPDEVADLMDLARLKYREMAGMGAAADGGQGGGRVGGGRGARRRSRRRTTREEGERAGRQEDVSAGGAAPTPPPRAHRQRSRRHRPDLRQAAGALHAHAWLGAEVRILGNLDTAPSSVREAAARLMRATRAYGLEGLDDDDDGGDDDGDGRSDDGDREDQDEDDSGTLEDEDDVEYDDGASDYCDDEDEDDAAAKGCKDWPRGPSAAAAAAKSAAGPAAAGVPERSKEEEDDDDDGFDALAEALDGEPGPLPSPGGSGRYEPRGEGAAAASSARRRLSCRHALRRAHQRARVFLQHDEQQQQQLKQQQTQPHQQTRGCMPAPSPPAPPPPPASVLNNGGGGDNKGVDALGNGSNRSNQRHPNSSSSSNSRGPSRAPRSRPGALSSSSSPPPPRGRRPRRRPVVNICFAYTSTDELRSAVADVRAALRRLQLLPGDVDSQLLLSAMHTRECPPVDLVLRTSGEQRLSDFVVWQAACAQVQVLPCLWPEITFSRVARCVAGYQRHHQALARLREAVAAGGGAPLAPACCAAADEKGDGDGDYGEDYDDEDDDGDGKGKEQRGGGGGGAADEDRAGGDSAKQGGLDLAAAPPLPPLPGLARASSILSSISEDEPTLAPHPHAALRVAAFLRALDARRGAWVGRHSKRRGGGGGAGGGGKQKK
jgi:undecaprenyl pyrophosphate synthase